MSNKSIESLRQSLLLLSQSPCLHYENVIGQLQQTRDILLFVEGCSQKERDSLKTEIQLLEELKNRLQNEIAEQLIDCGPETLISSYIEPEMILVEGGTFQMGSEEGESNEQPVQQVTLNTFAIARYQVTFEEYDLFCAATNREKPYDQDWGRGKRPVINVSWNDAVAYCEWLSKKTGKNYRLPTEAEWEFAAKGGIYCRGYTHAGSNDLREVGWYCENSGSKTQVVGLLKPNELGLFDMSGNVYEWCNDWYEDDFYANSPKENPKGPSSGSVRVVRGGSWYTYTIISRSANRYFNNPSISYYSVGFRVAQSV